MDQLHHASTGRGLPVILVHGIASSHHDWAPLISELAQHEYCCCAVDLIGHGNSPKPADPGAYTSENLFLTLDSWARSLGLAEPAVWIGHSLGGYLSLLHAIRRPGHTRALILIDPLVQPKQVSPALRMMARYPALVSRLIPLTPLWLYELAASLDYADTAHLPRSIRRQTAADAHRSSPFLTYLFPTLEDLLPKVRHVEAPTLVIWGEGDFTLNPHIFPLLCTSLPRSQAVPFPGCRHQPHRKEPDAVAEVILGFLSSLKQG